MKYAPNENLYLLEIILANVKMKSLALTVSHFMHTHRIKEPEYEIQ